MPAGPATLVIALVLLPGWIYWRREGSPRTSRSPLAELFEVVGAGALTSGVTALGYVLLLDRSDGDLGRLRLVDPTRATTAYAQDHLTRVALNAAAVVALSCALAWLLAWGQRSARARRDGDRSTYEPEMPLWVRSLGGKDEVFTVEMRDGRQTTGYLGGYSVDDEGTPTIYLTPPIVVLTPAPVATGWLKVRSTAASQEFRNNAITIPGTEVVSVWSPYSHVKTTERRDAR